ncbi:endonuclease/exonuclease/phosphatase family protein [Streptomyces sp. MI02-7b]|nr:endonuclease/exonuclease/phosphatase family protein [Streptomyces sp. MI02-7b]
MAPLGTDRAHPPPRTVNDTKESQVRKFRPVAALVTGLLLSISLPVLASGTPAAAAVAAGPGAAGPELGHANRTGPPAGLPDWSRVGYLGGQELPGAGDMTDDPGCRITPELLSGKYGVIANDGIDDTTGLQKAIDDIKSQCSPSANFHRLSLIELPAGRIDVSRQMYVDASFLIMRGKGSGDGGTKLVFRPDVNTRYDALVNGRWDQDGMAAGSGSDIGTGGWIWPGRGMFRVQTRDVADRYKDDFAAAPVNRKDLFEGSVNQHWVSGIKVAARTDDAGFSARQGDNIVQLNSKADMKAFTLGGYAWVGAANSVKFYEQQGVTDRAAMENLHMRQQMFRVTAVDSTAKTIRLDRPLEWDLPVDSTSDGSDSLGTTPYASKVTPLKVVEGVGFEDFAFTQDMNGLPKLGGGTYQLSPDQAVHNYGNMAPEYAMHGIVFKWAANSWARGLKATMTGSHPIVTENARNLQIERNSFDGAWNKGKGGNGYLRGSRVWDSLWAYNLSRNLRHFTFQWSASGNVAFRNDLDSDLNLHGGWEHNNLFEQNTVRVPYEHRSANCQTNCGGEGGEIDDGTWHPIWWAAGPKAVKWSGSSGPQNVFYNNTLIKQTTPGGPFEPYAPYSAGSAGAQGGTAFEFGSDNNAPHRFRPLSQDGQPIPDWTGRETLDYKGKGVVNLSVGNRSSLFLRDTGGGIDPRQNERRKVITWNMQGANTAGANSNKYSVDLMRLANDNDADIILLQEAGSPPPSAHPLRTIANDRIEYWDSLGYVIPVQEYRVGGTYARPQGYLYWLHTDTNETSPPGRVNLAIWTRERVDESNVRVIRSGFFDSRPALGVNIGGVFYFTVHGLSGSGNDDPQLLENIRGRMTQAGPGQTAVPWIALGDYNRAPFAPSDGGTDTSLQTALNAQNPNTFTVWAPSVPTHPTTQGGPPRTLDYAVTPTGPNAGPTVNGIARIDNLTTSDHYPVLYDLVDLPDQPQPGDQAGIPVPPVNAVMRNAGTTNVAGPSGSSNVVSDQPINQANVPMQTFSLSPVPEFPGYYRLIHAAAPLAGRYLGQEGGARDARVVLWPTEAADQLWAPVYQGDGTWTLHSYVTGQFLTAVNRGQALAGRDFDGSAGQRWFLETPAQATDVNEIALQDAGTNSLVLNIDDLEEGDLPVILTPDADEPQQRFITIPAGRTGEDECYYLAYDGKYINSTSGHPEEPRDDSAVTLSTFRGNDDGYLWCATPTDGGVFLSNHTTADDRLYLAHGAEWAQLTVRAFSPGIPVALWSLRSATK